VTLRAKILLVAVFSAALTALVSGVALYFLGAEQARLKSIIDVEVEAAKRIEGVKYNLLKARDAERLLTDFADEENLKAGREHVALMRAFADQAQSMTTDKVVYDKCSRLLAGIGRYEGALEDVGNLVISERNTLTEIRGKFAGESESLSGVLRKAADDIGEALAAGKLPPGEGPRIAARATEEVSKLDRALARFREGEALADAQDGRDAAVALQGLLAEARKEPGTGAIRAPLEEAVHEADALVARIDDYSANLASGDSERIRLAERTALEVEGLGVLAQEISTDLWKGIDGSKKEADKLGGLARGTIAAMALLSVGLGLLVAWLVATGLRTAVNRIAQVARTVAKGERPRVLPKEGTDEVGELAQAFNKLVTELVEQRAEMSKRDVQDAVLEITRVVSSTVKLKSLLDAALSIVADVSQSPVAGLYLLEERTGRYMLAAVHGAERSAFKENGMLPGEGIIGRAGQMERPWVLDRVPSHVAPSIQTAFGDIQPTCLVYQPVPYEGRNIGVLALARTAAADPRLLAILQVVSGQLGVALANATVHEQLERLVAERTQELSEVNRELAAKNVKVMELARLKSEFLSSMTHELRTPLNAIIGYTEVVLAKTPELPEKRRHALEKVLRNSRELLALINDILDLSKYEAGRMEVYREEFDVREMVEDCVATARQILGERAVKLTADVKGGEAPLMHDRMKIKQCLTNLLSNAVKFTQSGEIAVKVDVRADEVELAVVDTGIGIKAEDRERIFDEFRQSDGSIARKYGGTGLGLSITRRNCLILGGRISVDSTPGQGSTFRIVLPRAAPGEAAAEAGAAAAAAGGEPTPSEVAPERAVAESAEPGGAAAALSPGAVVAPAAPGVAAGPPAEPLKS
jgi:signal transduction histidine kinase/HAMP domain-containing protein